MNSHIYRADQTNIKRNDKAFTDSLRLLQWLEMFFYGMEQKNSLVTFKKSSMKFRKVVTREYSFSDIFTSARLQKVSMIF